MMGRPIRLQGYDYSRGGAYFVTICVQNRECLLGDIVDDEMRLNDAARMVERWWAELGNKFPSVETDEYVVMPNHFHGIIVLVGADLCVRPYSKGTHAGVPLLQRHHAHHVVFLDLGQHVQAVHDLPEDRILAVEERLRLQADIELAVGAVRIAQASHAHRPSAVLLLVELRRDRQAGSARPVARGIPTLDEKLRDDAVEG